MKRLAALSLGLLLSATFACGDPAGLPPESYPAETSASYFFGGGASVALEKTTNGVDADEPPGPAIAPGAPVIWEYRVTNTGSDALSNVFVTDDREGLICTIGTLAVGSEVVCRREGLAQADPYVNEGTARGTALFTTVSASDLSHYNGAVKAGAVLEIKIKPGDDTPCLNPLGKGRLPVAILGSAVFDVQTVDPATILAGGTVAPVKWSRTGEDINEDGFLDWVFHFKTQDLNTAGLLVEGEELVLSGQTEEGDGFSGSDLIHLVGGPYCGGGEKG